MTEKHNRILAAALIVQLIISVVVFWPSRPAAASGEPLFPGLEVGDVTSLTITDGPAGYTVSLSQVDGAWVLPEADDYPADESKVVAVLAKIVALSSDRLVARTDTSHGRLQVAEDDFIRRVEFQTQDGTEYAFLLGSSPIYGASHVRLVGQSETYLCEGIYSWEVGANASSWIDTAYVGVAIDEITGLTLENGSGTYQFARSEEGDWTSEQVAEGEAVIQTEVTSIASQASSLTIKEPLGKTALSSYGMEEPVAQLTLVTPDQTITIIIGSLDEDDGTYVVRSSQSDYFARAYDYSVRTLVEATRDGLFEPLATPTPEQTATSQAEEQTVTPESTPVEDTPEGTPDDD
jgi:hypothetical protein